MMPGAGSVDPYARAMSAYGGGGMSSPMAYAVSIDDSL